MKFFLRECCIKVDGDDDVVWGIERIKAVKNEKQQKRMKNNLKLNKNFCYKSKWKIFYAVWSFFAPHFCFCEQD